MHFCYDCQQFMGKMENSKHNYLRCPFWQRLHRYIAIKRKHYRSLKKQNDFFTYIFTLQMTKTMPEKRASHTNLVEDIWQKMLAKLDGLFYCLSTASATSRRARHISFIYASRRWSCCLCCRCCSRCSCSRGRKPARIFCNNISTYLQ